MESCIWISLSEYIDPDQSQWFDHMGLNEICQEPFPLALTCDRPQIGCNTVGRSPYHEQLVLSLRAAPVSLL